MKLKLSFETMELDDQIVAVPVGELRESCQGVVVVNETGFLILKLLMKEISEEEIVKKLREQYEVTEERAADDVHRYIEEFRKRDFLTE